MKLRNIYKVKPFLFGRKNVFSKKKKFIEDKRRQILIWVKQGDIITIKN